MRPANDQAKPASPICTSLICLQHSGPAGLPPQRGKLPFIWFDSVLRGTGPLLPVPILLLRWYATLPPAGADATAGPAMLELLVQIPPFTMHCLKCRSAVGRHKVASTYAASMPSRRAPSVVNAGALLTAGSLHWHHRQPAWAVCIAHAGGAPAACGNVSVDGECLASACCIVSVVLPPTHGNAGNTSCCLNICIQRNMPSKLDEQGAGQACPPAVRPHLSGRVPGCHLHCGGAPDCS